jgi:hypothetical protein
MSKGFLSAFLAVGAALGALVSASPTSYAQLRLEMRVVQSETLRTSQFLTGDDHGKPVALAGELRIPRPGTEKFPAVILIHGSGGIGAPYARWMS